jgi:hypothetical protein
VNQERLILSFFIVFAGFAGNTVVAGFAGIAVIAGDAVSPAEYTGTAEYAVNYTTQAYAVVYTMNAGVSHLQCYAHLIILCARICASPHSPLPTPFKCALSLSLSLIPFNPNKGILAGF